VKLYYSPHSPFVRKVLVVAYEARLEDRIELLKSAAGPVNRDAEIIAINPLGQVPTFIDDRGVMLADSRVICEYLDTVAAAGLFPAEGEARWKTLVEQSSADGLLAAALLCRYERLIRPAEFQWDGWYDGQFAKVTSTLDFLATRAPRFGERVDIGTIASACALSYLDHRFASFDWRSGHEVLATWFARFSERPSMRNTVLGVSKVAGM
jgi:glutathione S-transferase